MRDDMEPHDTGEVPDDGRPPLGASGALARLADVLQRLQRRVAAQGDALARTLLQLTTDTVTLAQGLVQGWDASQTAREDCLGTWRDHIQALETTGGRWKSRRRYSRGHCAISIAKPGGASSRASA